MGIALNPGCCCGSDYPAWTVYHDNVSEKLHYYIVSTLQILNESSAGAPFNCFLFYKDTSGSNIIYENCVQFSGGQSLSCSSENDSNAIVRMYLERTSMAPTGASPLNTWIKAAKINKFEISGNFKGYGGANRPIDAVLNYDSGKAQYTMGAHYCGCSGFPGALTSVGSTNTPSGFSVFPKIAGRVISNPPTTGVISDYTINGETIHIRSFSTPPYSTFSPNSSTSLDTSGVVHYSSGISGAYSTFIQTVSGCRDANDPTFLCGARNFNFYEYTFTLDNRTSGTFLKFYTYDYSLDSVTACCASARNASLLNYTSYHSSTTLFPYSFDCIGYGNDLFQYMLYGNQGNDRYAQRYCSNPFNPSVECTDATTLIPFPSGVCYCISGNYPSGYSLGNYGGSGGTCSFLVNPKPILATMRIDNFDYYERLISQHVYIDDYLSYISATGCVLTSYNPTGFVDGTLFFGPFNGPSASCNSNKTTNLTTAIGILDPLGSKHILEEFDASGFINLTISPWIGFSTAGLSSGYCPPSGTGIYTNTISNSGSGQFKTYSIGCSFGGGPTISGFYFSVPYGCEQYLNLYTNNINFSVNPILIPDSDLCIP